MALSSIVTASMFLGVLFVQLLNSTVQKCDRELYTPSNKTCIFDGKAATKEWMIDHSLAKNCLPMPGPCTCVESVDAKIAYLEGEKTAIEEAFSLNKERMNHVIQEAKSSVEKITTINQRKEMLSNYISVAPKTEKDVLNKLAHGRDAIVDAIISDKAKSFDTLLSHNLEIHQGSSPNEVIASAEETLRKTTAELEKVPGIVKQIANLVQLREQCALPMPNTEQVNAANKDGATTINMFGQNTNKANANVLASFG